MQFESAERKKRSAFFYLNAVGKLYFNKFMRGKTIISYREAACGGTCSNIEYKSRACGN